MTVFEVSVVIHSDRFIFGCLESLRDTWSGDPLALKIHIVANPATEESIDRLREQFPKAEVWENREQRGFAANHNMILEQATAPYVLVINDDIVFLPGALERMIEFMDAHQDVGMVGPKLLNPDRTLQASTYSFPTLSRAILVTTGVRYLLERLSFLPWLAGRLYRRPGSSRLWAHDQMCDVDTFRGACMLIRREVLDEVGLMDEVTMAYGEETEWCYRFWETGHRVVFLPDAEITHYGKQSTSKLPHIMVEVIKGYLNIFEKHGPRLRYHAFRLFLGLAWGAKYLAEYLWSDKVSRHTQEIVELALHPSVAFAGKRRFYASKVEPS